MSSENIASIYIEAVLDARKLREQVRDLENQRILLAVGVDDKQLTELNRHFDKKLSHYKEVQRYFSGNPLTVGVDDRQLTELNRNLSGVSKNKISFPIEIDDRNITKAIDNLRKTVEATNFRPKLEFDNLPLVNQINDAIEKVNQGGKLSVNVKVKESQTDRGDFRELSVGLRNIERATKQNKPQNNIFTGFQEALGSNIFKQVNLGVKDVFGKEIASVFRSATKTTSKSFKTNVLENEELQQVYSESENVILKRVRKGLYRLGDGVANALDATDKSFTERFNEITKASFDGVDVAKTGEEISNEFKNVFGKIADIFTRTTGNFLIKPIDEGLTKYREVALQERAIPLVRERALEVLNQKRSKNSGKLVDENTKELFITTGGYAGARGLSGERLAREINKEGVEGRQAIWVKNSDSDISKEAMSQASTKLVALLTSLGKPNIRGYSKDALEIASQALVAKEKNPEITIKILGESGGGFAAEEASKILDMLGIKNDFLGVGTPNFIGRLDSTQKRKIISPDEHLGAETNKFYGKIGLANLTPSQKIIGVQGHPYENYKNSNVAELQNFLYGSPGKFTPELKEQFQQGIQAFKNIDKSKLSAREIDQYSTGAYQNLQYIRRFLLEATEETEKDLQEISQEFENVYISLTPDTRDFTELKTTLNRAKQYLIALQAQPGLEASVVANNISKELDRFQNEVTSKSQGLVGTEQIKYESLLKEVEEVRKAFNNPLIGIKPPNLKPILTKIESVTSEDVSPESNNVVENIIEEVKSTQEDFDKLFNDKYETLKNIVENYKKNYDDFKRAISKGDKETAITKGREVLIDATGVQGVIKDAQKEFGLTGFDAKKQSAQFRQLLSQVSRTVNEVNRKSEVNKLDLGDITPLQIPLPDLKALGINANNSLVNAYVETNEKNIKKISEANQGLIEQTKDDFEIKSPSKVFQKIGENIVEGLNIGLSSFEDLSFDNILKNVGDSFKSLLMDGLKFSSVIFGISKALPFLQEFITQSIEVSRQMETVNRQVVFSAGGGEQGLKTLNTLRKTAKDLKLDIQETLKASSGFLASTEGTALEGNIGVDTFQNFQKLFRVKGGNKETQSRALLQLEQMAALGQIQNIDIKQLSMAVPGVRGILARSQGLTPGELQKATRQGLGSESLIQFSQQAAIESEGGLVDSLDTLDSKIQGLDNSIFELQEKVGNIFLPVQKNAIQLYSTGIELLTNNINGLMKGLTVLAVKFAYPFVEPLIKQFWNLIKTIDLAKIKFNGIGKFINETFTKLKPMLAEFLISEAIFTSINKLRITFSDLGGDISKAAKSGKKDLEELQKSLNPEFKIKSQLIDNPFQKFGKDLMEDPLKVLNPFDSRRHEETKKLNDTLEGVKKILTVSRELSTLAEKPIINTSIKELNQIDSKITDVQTKRRGVVETSPQDTKTIQNLQKQEQELIQKRFEILKPVATLQGNLAKRIEDLKNSQKALDEFKDDGTITKTNYEQGSKAVAEELAKLEPLQQKINKAVGETKNAFSLVRRELNSLNTDLEDTKSKLENISTKSKINLSKSFLDGNLTKGNKEFLTQVNEIQSAYRNLQALSNTTNQKTVAFQSKESQRILDSYGVSANTGVAKINKLLENIENQNDKFILEEFSKLQQSKTELLNSQFSLLQLQEQLKIQLQEQTKQVNEYFTGISRQVVEANLEFKRQLNQVKSNNITTKLRAAIGESEDGFLNTFVDSLVSQIESATAILNEQLNKKSKLSANQFQLEDSIKQARDLKLSLPSGELPSIPVELNFNGVNDDKNLIQLQDSFKFIQNDVDNVSSGVENLDNLISSNVETTSKLTNEFNNSFEGINKVNNETLTTSSNTETLKDKVSLVTSETTNFNDEMKKVNQEVNFIQSAFNGVTSWINQAVTATGLWFNKLIEGNELLKNILNNFQNIGQQIGSTFNGAVDSAKDFGKGAINQLGFSTGGQQLGMASPSTTQNLQQVLRGSVTQAQSFNSPRPQRKGIHNGIDFDSTEGLGGGQNFNNIFPGKVLNLRQWGKGARDVDGKESNALRIESALPRGLGNFTVDYGHYKVDTSRVRQGQFVTQGTTLGTLSQNDSFSQGGHLDLKIRIPSSIAGGFKNTRDAGGGQHFVDVKEFMNWYQRQLGVGNSNVDNRSGGDLTVPATFVNSTNQGRRVNNVSRSTQQPVLPNIKRGGNELTQAEYNRLTPLGKQLYELRNNPNILALGDTVARAEGTDFRNNSKNYGYSMMIGGGHDTDFSRHPFVGTGRRPIANSTAAGRYQMMNFNYSQNAAKKQFGRDARSDLSDIFQGENPGTFSPAMQDLYFIYSLKSRQVLDEVLKGDMRGALTNVGTDRTRQLPAHYASLQTGSGKKSFYGGQGTPEGQLQNTLPFVQSRLQFQNAVANNRGSGRGQENLRVTSENIRQSQPPILKPQQLQQKVDSGLKIQQQQIQQSNSLVNQQSEDELKRQRLNIARQEEVRINNLRKNLEENQSIRLTTTRRTQDLRTNINPIKSTTEEFADKIQNLNREYDDIILELSRKSQSVNRSLDKSKKLLAAGEVTGKDRGLLESKIKDDEKTLQVITKELENVKKLRSQATNEAKKVFNREEFIRQQQITFEETSKQIGVLKGQLEGLQTVQQNNPLDERVAVIPGMQREIQILETNLELNQEISRIEERRFRKELTQTQADTQIQRAREINQEKQKTIELTFTQAEAEANLRRQSLELDKRSRFAESDFGILQERIKQIELLESRNPLKVSNPIDKLNRQEDLQIRQLGLESEKQIQSILEFANSIKLPQEETLKLIKNIEELNSLKLSNIKTEFENLREEANIKRLEDVNNRENRIGEFNNSRAFSREQLEIDAQRNSGGNEFVLNDRSRRLGRVQEIFRFEKEQRDFGIEVARMRQAGIEIPEDALSKVKEDMQAIHNLNLDNINNQFKTFGQTLNDIGKNSIQGLSQGITGLIMGTQSLNNVLDNFFNNILSQVLNTGLQSLLGGLLGGMGGFKLFYDGGIVNYAEGGFRKERNQSGRNPQLAIVHDGELIIPYKRVMELSRKGLGADELLGRFSEGGVVGNKKMSSLVNQQFENTQQKDIKVESTVINQVEYVTIEQFREGVKKAAKQGAEGGLSMVQSKMSGSVSWRGSVGF